MQQIEERPFKRRVRRPVLSPPRARPGLREARREANRRQAVGDLRCECGQLSCHLPIPAIADVHRAARDGFLVVPGHQGKDVVVAAADRFFLVELKWGQAS